MHVGGNSVARWYIFNQNPNLGKFWKVLQWKMLVFLLPFCLFYGQMVYLMDIWYIFGVGKNQATLVGNAWYETNHYATFLNVDASVERNRATVYAIEMNGKSVQIG
jgi:hypothetical protein